MAETRAQLAWPTAKGGIFEDRDSPHWVPLAVVVCLGYYGAARLGLAFTFPPLPISALWPPNAVLLAVLLLVPPQRWWIVVAAALPAHLVAELQDNIPVRMVLCWFASNVSEAVIGATCVRFALRRPVTFEAPGEVMAFAGAAFLAALLSSFLDAGFVALNDWGQSGYWDVWRSRVISNLTASLIVTPTIVTLALAGTAAVRAASRARIAEALALTAGLLAVTYVVFDTDFGKHGPVPLIYLPLPFLLWAALRFGPAGASTAFAGVAIISIWGASHGTGVLGANSPLENARAVQFFLIAVGPTLLCLAAALHARRAAEHALRESDRRFQVVLEATRDSIYEHDLASGSMWWNRDGLSELGYGRDEQPSFEGWSALIHPDDRWRALEAPGRAMDAGQPFWDVEFRVRRRDGEYAQVHEQGFIVRQPDGRAAKHICALTDVTERRAGDELRLRLEHASRLIAMGELAASIAHEINQPIASILTNVEAARVLLDRDKLGDTEMRAILDDIRDDDLRAAETMRHIRDLANKREIAFAPFDANELIHALAKLVGPLARRRGMSVHLGCDDIPMVRGDRLHVHQVLLNLVLNAMDAMADSPPSTRHVRISSRRVPGDFVEIAVRDAGHGIAAGNGARIFESFFTTKEDGMGLGLSIARSIVRAHGGEIVAENNAGGGATVRFTLPTVTGA